MSQLCSSDTRVLHHVVTGPCSWLTVSFMGIKTLPSGMCPNPYSFLLKKQWLYQKNLCYSKLGEGMSSFSFVEVVQKGSDLQTLWGRPVAIFPHGYKQPGKKEQSTWMRLICHGKSIYFTDLNLGSPTSSLYSCGPLLVYLSSFITFWSKISLMRLMFETECVWDWLCYWQSTVWSSGRTHATFGSAKA